MSTAGDGGDPTLIPSLPNDVSVNILARVPRAHHPALSLVSRPIRAFLSSPLLYRTRSLLGSTQPTLYFSLDVPFSSSPGDRWFSLAQTPPAPRLCPLPSPPFSLYGSALAVVGPRIYVIGGFGKDGPSQSVLCLDCRTHTWKAAPSMRVAREAAAPGVVDGRVYVIGGCDVDTSDRSRNWAEVFDPAFGRWDPVDSSGDMVRPNWMRAGGVVDGRVYAIAEMNGVVYEPRTGQWVFSGELGSERMEGACVVGGVLYFYDSLGNIRGLDVGKEGAVWKELRWVERVLPRAMLGPIMTDLGGNLVVIWQVQVHGRESASEIWGAEIEVELKEEEERSCGGECCGVLLFIGLRLVQCRAWLSVSPCDIALFSLICWWDILIEAHPSILV